MQKCITLDAGKRTGRDAGAGGVFSLSIFLEVGLGDKRRSRLVRTWD